MTKPIKHPRAKPNDYLDSSVFDGSRVRLWWRWWCSEEIWSWWHGVILQNEKKKNTIYENLFFIIQRWRYIYVQQPNPGEFFTS